MGWAAGGGPGEAAGVGFEDCGSDGTICSGAGTEGISDMEAGADVEGRAGAVGGVVDRDETLLTPLDPSPGLSFPSSFFLNRESRLILFGTPSTAGGVFMAVCRIVLGRGEDSPFLRRQSRGLNNLC